MGGERAPVPSVVAPLPDLGPHLGRILTVCTLRVCGSSLRAGLQAPHTLQEIQLFVAA